MGSDGWSFADCLGGVLAPPAIVAAALPIRIPDDDRVVRARSRIISAREVARRGRYASAERMLRDALGVLERRRRYAGAARAAATLGELLRERGQTQRLTETLDEVAVAWQYVAGVEFFPLPYVELRPEYRLIDTLDYRFGQATLQVHLFY